MLLSAALPLKAEPPNYCALALDELQENAVMIKPSELTVQPNILKILKGFKALLLPRLGYPSYKGSDFDISLVGHSRSAPIPPALVMERAKSLAEELFSSMKKYSISPKHRTHFVIEIAPNGLGDETGKVGFLDKDKDKMGPFTAPEGVGIIIQGIGSIKTRLKGSSISQVIVIPMDEFGGPLLNKFVIAHEIGHDLASTGNPSFNEAIADYMAQLLTGDHAQ